MKIREEHQDFLVCVRDGRRPRPGACLEHRAGVAKP